jgi:preprotein translocase subunit SecB
MTETTAPTSVSIAVASELSRVLRLENVRFAAVSARSFSSRPASKLKFDMPVIDAVWRLEGAALDVLLPFVLHVRASDEPTVLFEVEVSVMVSYASRNEDPLDPERCRNYAGINGFLHAWPYVRAEVQMLSTKLGYPPLTLPAIVVDNVPPRVRVGRPVADAVPAKEVTALVAHVDLPVEPRQTKRRSKSKA